MKIIPTIEACATNSIRSEASVTGDKISLILIGRLIAAFNAAQHHGSIAGARSPQKRDYSSVLETFKIDHEAYLSVKDEDNSKVPKINARDNDRKIICWDPIFKDCLSSSCGSRGPLIYVLREDPTVHDEVVDPLLPSCYFGESGSLISELDSCL